MESPAVDHVALMAERVAAYGEQLAAVFHNHALGAERIPRGFEGSINILDATVATLKQALSLLREEATGAGQQLFNDEAIRYVQLLTSECATSLAKIEPILVDACLSAKNAREKRKADRKAVAKNGEPKIDPFKLALDEKAFLETIETTKWSRATFDIQDCMDRLYDLQLHLLLVFQVVKVGALSRDLSSGKVDIKSIISYHERISRTADLLGIKTPTGSSRNSRPKYDSFSDSDSIILSDSDDSSRAPRRGVKNFRKARRSSSPPISTLPRGPPPPPPANWAKGATPSTAALPPSSATDFLATGGPTVNPPSYSESHKSATGDTATSAVTSAVSHGVLTTLLESAPAPMSDVKTPVPAVLPAETKPVKEPIEETKKTLVLEPRLFKGNTNSFGFKFKTLFRSKQSLAEEMKKALSESESQLLAFVLRGYEVRQVPHSAFHGLEATHMRTILSQINDNSWYKTFTSLTPTENQALQQMIRPWSLDPSMQREIVVLKVIEQNRIGDWMVLLKELLYNNPAKSLAGNRVLLAIVREKLVNGKPASNMLIRPGPPPPPPPGHLRPKHPVLRPPPGLPVATRSITRISDLRYPPPPSAPPGWHVAYPLGFLTPRNPIIRPSNPNASEDNLPIIKDPTTYDGKPDDFAADRALRVYTEYTLRQVDYPGLSQPKSWARVSVTQESHDRDHLLDRIHDFKRTGGDIIEIKLRLSENQSTQLSRLLDELKSHERDGRFDWSWAAISLYTHSGLIANKDLMTSDQDVPFNFAPTATVIHLIAERTLRHQYVPIEVYKAFMNPYSHPKPMAPPYSPPGPPGPSGPPPNGSLITVFPRKQNRRSRYASSSGSGSDSSSDSDSSVGGVRRRLRRNKARKVRRARNRASRLNGDDSGSDSDSEDEDDIIEIKLELKRGDDVLKALLELWTPQTDVKGKGKLEA